MRRFLCHARSRGWVSLAGSALTIVCTLPGHTMGFAFFLPQVRAELGLSAVTMPLIWAGALAITMVIMVPTGFLIERAGPWRATVGVALPLGISIACVGTVTSALGLLLALASVRLCTVSIAVVSSQICANWFVRLRGRASLVIVFAFFIMPAFGAPVRAIVESQGWRAAYRTIGIISSTGALLASCLVSDRPERHGLAPDGERASGERAVSERADGAAAGMDAAAADRRAGAGPDDDGGLTLREAQRTPQLWILIVAISVTEGIWTGINFNVMDLLSEERSGLPTAQLLLLLDVLAGASISVSILTAYAIEKAERQRRDGLRPLIVLMSCMAATSAALIGYVNSFGLGLLFVLMHGGMMGIFDVLLIVALPQLFGKQHVSSISGFLTGAMQLCAGGGPVLLGAATHLSDVRYVTLPLCAIQATVAAAALVWFRPLRARQGFLAAHAEAANGAEQQLELAAAHGA